MSPSLQPDRRLAIDALVADSVPSPPRTRQCGKCQEAHTRCDGRDPCHSCEVRGTLCGYAWSSFSAPPPPAPAPAPRAPGYAQHVLYFPPPAKRPVRPESSLSRAPPADGGWAVVPAGTNAPAVTRGGEPGPPIKPCKTCQARNTTCDGVLPVCGSCRTRRLECYIATPTAATVTERPRVQSLHPVSVRDKAPVHPRAFPLSMAQAQPLPGRNRALSSNEDGKPSRASLSFMLNPSPAAELPVASSSRAPPPRPPELKRPVHSHHLPAPTALVTPPTPITAEHALSRMDVDVQPPRSASPLSPTSSTGGADLSRRPSRKRSASPSSYERYGSSSPSRESVSSAGGRPSFDSRAGRTPTDSRPVRTSLDSRSPPVDSRRSTRLSIDSARPAPADEERTRSKSSLSHLLDGDGQGGMRHAVPISDTRHAIPLSDVRPPSDARLASDARHPILPPDVRHVGPPPSSSAGTSSRPNSKRGSISTAMAGMQLKSAATSRASSPGSTRTRSPGTIQAHAWPTFGAVGETMATGPAFNGPGGPAFNPTGERAPAFNMANERSDVWRNETEADMRRREVEAEERKRARLRLVDVEMEGVVREEGRVGEVDRHSDVDSRRHADLDQRRLGDLDSRRHADSDARRYVDPETRLRQGEVDLHRRRSEGAKRRRIGSEEEMAVEPDVSIVEQIRRASGEDVMARRTSEDPSKRASGESVARQMSNGDGIIRRGTGDRRTTGDDIIPKRVVRDDPIPRRTTTDESVQRRESSDNSISALRRGSIPMPGGWIAEERESAIVVSDSPELQSNDRMILEADEPKDSLISGPVEVSSKGGDGLGKNGVGNRDGAREGPSKNGVGEAPKVEPVSKKDGVVESIKAKRSPSTEGRNGSTPPVSTPFSHIWPPPSMSNLETKKGGRKAKTEPEPAPSRSFITQRNLSIAPAAPPAEEDTKDKDSGGSSLRSMLTTMPPRAVFMTAVQTFLAQPKRKGRTVVMTKALMKDALGVLLDPTTEELLKDYVQPEQPNPNKDEDKSSRDGTPRSSRIDASDHTTLEFRAWTKRMFSTVKTGRGEEVVLAFGGKPVVVEDDIYETIVLSHSKGNHCSTEETVRLVDQAHSWVPRLLVEAFVQECPGCPASNKVASTVAKPKKRKWVRKDDKPAGGAATTKRKPAARRGKKGQGQQEGGKRRKGKEEASPADESDGEVEEEQEQEQELEGEQEQEQEPEPEMEEDELGEDGAEEEEMESEDEHVSARPVAIVASSVPVGDSKMEVD